MSTLSSVEQKVYKKVMASKKKVRDRVLMFAQQLTARP